MCLTLSPPPASLMLRASFTLTPAAAEGADGPAPAAAPEHVRDVYLCTASPAVTEEWEGSLDAPQVVAGAGARYSIPVPPTCASLGGRTVSHGDAARTDGVPHPIPLEVLRRGYQAQDGEERSGSAWVQVYAIGAHAALSLEAKAMLCACVMAALRAQLCVLLRRCPDPTSAGGVEEGPDSAAAGLLRSCCRGPASADGGAVDKAGGRWRVTWTPELLRHVAASLDAVGKAGALSTVRVEGCAAMLRASVQLALQERLRRDLSRPSSPSSHASSGEVVSSKPQRFTDMHVALTSCAPVASHPLDLRRAVHLTRELHVRHVQPAQAHAEDGADAFQRLARLTAPLAEGPQARAAASAWAQALELYAASATSAQAAVLLVLQRDTSTHAAGAAGAAAALLPLSTREERSRAHVARRGLTASAAVSPALQHHIIASVQVRSAAASFNDVLLFHAWGSRDGEVASVADRLAHDSALGPARAAMQWRSTTAAPPPSHGTVCDAGDDFGHDRNSGGGGTSGGQTLSPTPLQWVLYTAQRQLVVAVANRAQVVLTGRRLGLHTTAAAAALSAEAATVPQFNAGALRAMAAQCVKALVVTRRLLEWHCPWPAPPHVQRHPLDPAAVAELAWVLRLLAKLQWRAAQLYAAAGDTAEQRRQVRELRDAVQRWGSRRRAPRSGSSQSSAAGGAGWAAPASLEDVVCHVDEETWAVLLQDIASMLPAV